MSRQQPDKLLEKRGGLSRYSSSKDSLFLQKAVRQGCQRLHSAWFSEYGAELKVDASESTNTCHLASCERFILCLHKLKTAK